MKATKAAFALMSLAFLSGAMLGCEKQPPAPNSNNSTPPNLAGAGLPSGLFVTAAPANAKTVEEVKATAKTGDAVVMRGRVGGSEEPFVEGRAVFTLVGSGLKACSDKADDKCKTPWDYCCDTPADIAKHSATVQVVDAAGAPIKASIKGQNGIKELSELTIAGKVVQANEKVVIIAASAIYNSKP